MQRFAPLVQILVVVMLTGCQLWAETDYERDQRIDGSASGSDSSATQDAPVDIQNWFYREFGNAATIPDLTGATESDTVNAVAAWVDGFTMEPTGADHQYRTSGETVDAAGGDSSSMAWLNYIANRENGIINVSVEMVLWDAGAEEYVCIWRNGGSDYVIDGASLVLVDTFLMGVGHLEFGFDDIDYWEY